MTTSTEPDPATTNGDHLKSSVSAPALGGTGTSTTDTSTSTIGDTVSDWTGYLTVIAIVLAIVVPIGSSAFYALSGRADKRVTVVTMAANPDSAWHISGNVQVDGEPIRARISVIASDPQGNRYAPAPMWTDSVGHFALTDIPARLSRDTTVGPVSEVTVRARARESSDTSKSIAGEETLRLTGHARTRWVQLPPYMLLTVFVVFLMSVTIGLFHVTNLGGRRVQYYGSILLAFLLTGSVVSFISLGLRHVNATGTQGDVVALGFANVYKGTYVKDLSPEWLFSLTAPWQGTPVSAQSAASSPPVARGFGVPLWALLIAVSGAGLFTIRLVVKQVMKPVDLLNDADFRPRLQEVVLHQFYILFAPVGAVFVYQFLVIAGAASVETTVALAMLAAGVVLNTVLDRALHQAEEVVQENKAT